MDEVVDPGILISQEDLEVDDNCIGSGSFGKVFEASWKGAREKVVLKKLKVPLDSKRLKKKCLKEVEVLYNMRHENIIKVYGVLNSDDLGIVMEFAHFGCLSDILEDHAPLSWALKTDFLFGMACGMEYLHEHNMRHGDLKASNVLVNAALDVKLCDFGVSQWREVTKHSSQVQSYCASTITHVAPERLADINCALDNKSDVFSYAIVAWELLTDKTPYFGIPADRIQTHVLSGGRPNMDSMLKGAPEPLKLLMVECWNAQPDSRPTFTVVRHCITECIAKQADFKEDLLMNKNKILEKAGLKQESQFADDISDCKQPLWVEMDSQPVNIDKRVPAPRDSLSDPPAYSLPCQESRRESRQESSPSADPPPYEDLMKPGKGMSKEPFKNGTNGSFPLDKEVLEGLQNIDFNGITAQGKNIQLGNNNIMTVSYKGDAKKSKIVKMCQLTKSTKIITDEVINYVSNNTGRKWRAVGRRLKFSDGELDIFSNDYRDDLCETIHQMLRRWREKEGRNATVHNLVVALAREGKGDVSLHISDTLVT